MKALINYNTKQFKLSFIASCVLHIMIAFALYINFKSETRSTQNIQKIDAQKQHEPRDNSKSASKSLLSPKPSIKTIVHTVKPGESFWVIANTHNTTIENILNLNGLTTDHVLKAGEEIKVKIRQ